MSTKSDRPKVLIVGAGLEGLLLGALLEKERVPYQIFERATTVKPLGILAAHEASGPFTCRRIVPSRKIHFGHRVLNITEEDSKDTIEGDIIVGADGAYSAIRQRMYEQLKAPCPIAILLTRMEKTSRSLKTSKAAMEQCFRHSENSECGDYPAQSMCEETRNFPIQLLDGKKRTLGDLYDQTPKEFISKVMLEEEVFTTWHYRRYVLLGDACHKLNPSGGHGAVTAMHDAVALANMLYSMPTRTLEDITRIFEEYQKERLPAVTQS
ncbi:FAD/NAD(P)-binding domain-containing protein [Linnemannia elongata AG-77]|uniref:FAD/NAD(P)-binding domain-containing protein n=1 Tax=Linnemannia elongata AG-77 TaxID=1314771 RepID=A0A197K5Y7_9FUNG|nr:FAD/NAD(P)-binding domain-containing protein [Linnemannia elongata AG-77]